MGIDNGVNGGIVVLDDNANVIFKSVMPTIIIKGNKKQYDALKILDIFREFKNANVYLEKAQPMFRDGKKQSFKTGYGYGLIEGMLLALGMSYEIVRAKEWQKEVLKGYDLSNTKSAAYLFASKKWSTIDWRATERSKKFHDGIIDAVCIAYYGYKKEK